MNELELANGKIDVVKKKFYWAHSDETQTLPMNDERKIMSGSAGGSERHNMTGIILVSALKLIK